MPETLAGLADLAAAHLPDGYRTPVTVRLRLGDATEPVDGADLEARLKLALPQAALSAGASAVEALCGATVDAFGAVLEDRGTGRYRDPA